MPKINIQGTSERSAVVKQGGVSIAQNIKRSSEMFDRFGNVIHPRTKQIIKSVDESEQ